MIWFKKACWKFIIFTLKISLWIFSSSLYLSIAQKSCGSRFVLLMTALSCRGVSEIMTRILQQTDPTMPANIQACNGQLIVRINHANYISPRHNVNYIYYNIFVLLMCVCVRTTLTVCMSGRIVRGIF